VTQQQPINSQLSQTNSEKSIPVSLKMRLQANGKFLRLL